MDARALETVPCQSLATYRAEAVLFEFAVEDVVEPIVEAIDPVATALSSYDPGKCGRSGQYAHQ